MAAVYGNFNTNLDGWSAGGSATLTRVTTEGRGTPTASARLTGTLGTGWAEITAGRAAAYGNITAQGDTFTAWIKLATAANVRADIAIGHQVGGSRATVYGPSVTLIQGQWVEVTHKVTDTSILQNVVDLIVSVYETGVNRQVTVYIDDVTQQGESDPFPSFSADIATHGLTKFVSVNHPEGIAVVDDPILGSARKALRMTTLESYTSINENPRTQVEAPYNLLAGHEVFIGWATLFPTNFPTSLPQGGWVSLGSVYGPPYNGKGPLGLGVSRQMDLHWERNDTYNYDRPWVQPLTRNVWHDFVHRIKLSEDPAVGFVELYLNTGDGWVQQPLNGQQRLYMKTLDHTNHVGPNGHALSNYRSPGMFDSLTIYYADYRIGHSFDEVAPDSHPASGGTPGTLTASTGQSAAAGQSVTLRVAVATTWKPLVDRFDDNGNVLWDAGLPYNGTIGSGVLTIPTANFYPTVWPIPSVNLIGQTATIRFVTSPSTSASANNAYFQLGNRDDLADYLGWMWTPDNRLVAEHRSNDTIVNKGEVAYSAGMWLRIGESAGTVRWWTSTNGTNWTQRGSMATSAVGFPLTNLEFKLGTGNWQGQTNLGTAVWDDLEVTGDYYPVSDTPHGLGVGFFVPQDGSAESITDIETMIGAPVTHHLWFADLPNTVPAALAGIVAAGRIPVVGLEPWDSAVGGPAQPAWTLAATINGNHDAHYTRWANALKAIPGEIWMRFAHEMNGTWYPWAAGVNGNTNAQYIAAWRRVHGIFQTAGATNVKWMWAPNTVFGGSAPIPQIYPGDAYVDLLGVDGYNWVYGSDPARMWESPPALYSETLQQLRTVAPGKRIWIAEMSSAEQTATGSPGTRKAQWVQDFFDYASTQPDLDGFLWFHIHKERDWRINSTPTALAAFVDAQQRINGASGGTPATLTAAAGQGTGTGQSVTFRGKARFVATVGVATGAGGSMTVGGGSAGIIFTAAGTAASMGGTIGLTAGGAGAFTTTPAAATAAGGNVRLRVPVIIPPAPVGSDFGIRLACYSIDGDLRGRARGMLIERYARAGEPGRLKVGFSEIAPRPELFTAPVEIAVEYLDHDGAWAEPEDGRYTIAQGDHERTADPTRTHDLTLVGIAARLNAAKVLIAPAGDIQTDGKRQFLSKTPGQIIGALLTEAKGRGAFPTLEAGFTDSHDSHGQPWTLVYNRAYELNHSLLGILQNLHDGGACDYWTQGRVLHMVPAGERGRDLTLGQDPVYLRDLYAAASPERDDWTRLANHAVLIGDEGARWEKTNPEAYAPFGRIETVILGGGVSNQATAMLMIDRALAEGADVARQLTREWQWQPATRWMPDRDIRVGDWVLADTAAGTRQRVRVADLMTRHSPDGIEAFITLGTIADDMLTRMAKRQIGIEGGAGVGSIGRPTPKPPPDPTSQYGQRPGNFTVTVSAWPIPAGYGGVFGASWEAVTTDTDGYAYEPDEYVVHARKAGGPWMDMFRTTSLTGQTERTDMRPGEVWEAQVAARRGAQTGVWSPLWIGTIPEDKQAPPTPSQATGESPPGQLVIGWDGLAEGGGAMPLDLKLVEVHLNGVTREEWKIGITGGTLRLDAGPDTFTIGDMMETRLVAVDWAGNRSDGSDPIWVGISEHAQWPGAPTGLVASASSFMTPEGVYRGMISAAWGEVTTDADGDPIDIRGYGLRARRTAGQFTTDWFDIAGTDSPTALSVTGTDELMNVGDTWQVAVAATSTAGHTGPASEPVEVVIPPDDVAPPVPSRPTVTSSRALLTVAWDGLAQGGGGMPPDLWFLTVHITGLADTWTLDRTTRVVHISGLAIGTTYEVRLTATDYADNTSDPSQPSTPVELRSVMDDTDWQALMSRATSYGDNLYPDANYTEQGRNTVRAQYGWTLTAGEGRATPTSPVPGEARILWLTPSGTTDTATALTPGDTYQLSWRIDTPTATDITVVRGLDGQAPIAMHAPVAQAAGSDQAWNYTITAVAGNRYGIQVTGGPAVYRTTFRKRVTTTMVDDGAIVADKIAVNQAMAERFSGLLAEFDTAFVGVLTADMLSTTALDFQEATGLILTAPNIQSTAEPMRGLKLTTDYKRVYNATGVITLSENYATGDIELSGAIRNRASGYPRFELLPGDNPSPGWSGIQWVPGPGWNLLPALSTNAIRSGEDTPGGLYLRGANWHALTSTPEISLRSGRVINNVDTFWPEIDLWLGSGATAIGRIRLRDIGQGKTAILAHADFFNFNTPGGQQYIRMPVEGTLGDITIRTGNGGIINHVADGRFVVTGLHGTTGGATVTIETDGRMMRYTSLSEYKLEKEDIPAVWELLDVTPKTWIDRARREADPDYCGRFAGFVAEDVQAVSAANGGSLDPLLIRDDDGSLQGVAYQSWVAYQQAILRELRDRIELLEAAHA